MPSNAPRGRPEALLERQILLALGSMPDVLAAKNEVGSGFSRGCLDALRSELDPGTFARVSAILARWSITFGLGKGSPDLLVFVAPGRAILAELKAGSSLSEDQQRWHAAARARGVNVQVWRSVAEAVAAVEEVRRCR